MCTNGRDSPRTSTARPSNLSGNDQMSFSRFFTRTIAALSIVTLASLPPSAARDDDSIDQEKRMTPPHSEWLEEGVQEVNQGDQLVIIKLADFESDSRIRPIVKVRGSQPPFAVYSDAALDVDHRFEIGTYGASEGISISPSWITLQSVTQVPLQASRSSSGWGLPYVFTLFQYNKPAENWRTPDCSPYSRQHLRASFPRPQEHLGGRGRERYFQRVGSGRKVLTPTTSSSLTPPIRMGRPDSSPQLVVTTNQTSWNSDQS